MNRSIYSVIATSSLAAVLAGCSSSAGDGSASNNNGIGGTGVTSSGTIDGFGSIFVNGIRYDTDASIITIDGVPGTENDLRLGMIVTVTGSVQQAQLTGIAATIDFDDDLQGPVSAVTDNGDGTKTLAVLGIDVLVDETTTAFDGTSFATLGVGDLVEVSGFTDPAGDIIATRVEREGAFVADASEVELQGTVSGLAGMMFTLGGFTVDATLADLSDLPGGMLADGQTVEVDGTLNAAMDTITATEVELEDGPFDIADGEVELEGVITNYVSDADFQVAGQQVNASTASLEPVSLVLADGLQVEVEGELVGGVLIADEVEAREGDIELGATIQNLAITDGVGTITLGYVGGSVTVNVNGLTQLEDDSGMFDPIAWDDLRIGDYLEVNALLGSGGLQATEVELDSADDDRIEGPVTAFVANTSVSVLGVTFTTAGADFSDENDNPITEGAFYAGLALGDLVEVQDDLVADGVADEVELEDD